MSPRPALLSLCVLAASACVINGDAYPRPRDLSPAWRVDKLRLLAIRADPPEIRPGEGARFEALLVDPEQSVSTTLWVACGEEEATDFGCPFDPTSLDPEATPEELAEAGIIGIEPFLPPTYTAPEDLLAGIDDERLRTEGVNVTINALALPEVAEDDTEFDFNQVESGFKRLVVSEATTPNENPEIVGFQVDGIDIATDQLVLVDPAEAYELAPVLADDAVQTYEYLNIDGVVEERTEEPWASWYATDGEVTEDTTLPPFLESTWIAPEAPGVEGTWWVLIRDRRGGLAWTSRRFRTSERVPDDD